MNALRSRSAVAARRLASPPVAAPLCSSRFLSSSSLSSSSSPSFTAQAQRSLSSISLSRVAASSRWSGASPVTRTQIRTMASESKIKVKNPVVELDGDEVRKDPFCSSNSLLPVSQACASFSFWNAGNHGGPEPFMCQSD